MRFPRPFFWRPAGVFSALSELPLSDGVLQKDDVSRSVGSSVADAAPLIVAELAGGKIVGDLRLAATQDDRVIGGIQTVFACEDLPTHYALHRRRFRLPKYRRGRALLLGAANSNNYYHWLLESLPRWKMMEVTGHFADYAYVLLHNPILRYQEEVLDLLGVPPEKRLRCGKNFVHQFERLVVPDMPQTLRQIAPWTCKYVRSLFPVQPGGPEKIYITRRATRRRRLVNEAELEKQLQALGFVLVQPENLSVAQQAALFSSAKCVVASHGAGLVNMVFAPEHTLLVELFHPDILRPTYKNLSASSGQRYQAFIGRHTSGPVAQDEDESEFQISIPEVVQFVAENVSAG